MNILAAFIFFIRLLFWRIREVPAECFRHVVPYWPLSGWLTGGITAGVLWSVAQIFPFTVAVLLALANRLLITGTLHEDRLVDFFSGFGGGTSREHILSIMKDSHIGGYGVIGLIAYFSLLWDLLTSLPLSFACSVLITDDIVSELTSSQVINFLSYAQREEESKTRMACNRMSQGELAFGLLCRMLPLTLLLPYRYRIAIIFPLAMLYLLYRLMKQKLQGYTGGCCGTLFLLSELSFYLRIVILIFIQFDSPQSNTRFH